MVNISEENYCKYKSQGLAFPVILEANADELTPIGIYYSLDGKNKFLLESALGSSESGRYSFIGADPYMTVRSSGDDMEVVMGGSTERIRGKVLDYVREHMEASYIPEGISFPFTGGAVGYVGYDIIRQYEKLPDINADEMKLPEACLMFYKSFICYDRYKHTLSIIYNVFPDEDKDYSSIVNGIKALNEKVRYNGIIHKLPESSGKKEIQSNFSREEFCTAVNKAKEYIVEGDAFQIVLSQRLSADTESEPFDIYRRLRSTNPSPYLFYIDFTDFQIIGSSPESLVSVYGDKVTTNPIAGTKPRGRNEKEDKALREELIVDEKERAEHVMLVDLGRNDVGRISKFGSVTVERFMEVDFYSHVMHMVSKVSGRLKEGITCFNALTACLPAGTLSGAPKVRAMEIIDELENVRRGIYGGAVGYFSYNGNMDTCIAIRTIVYKDKKAYIQAGAGIVFDSDPVSEYKETLNKAMALREVL
ncbi:MAG: anthranilate synthase component I [Clostridia bacterium]